MFDKLDFILEKYEELALKVSDPDIINNQPVWQKHVKEMGEMEPLVNKYKEYKMTKDNIAAAKEMLDDPDEEMREMLKEELEVALQSLTEREQKVIRLRFGLEDGKARTLEEVGQEFSVTRERIRQIEAKALRKLRHPQRSKKLKDFLA